MALNATHFTCSLTPVMFVKSFLKWCMTLYINMISLWSIRPCLELRNAIWNSHHFFGGECDVYDIRNRSCLILHVDVTFYKFFMFVWCRNWFSIFLCDLSAVKGIQRWDLSVALRCTYVETLLVRHYEKFIRKARVWELSLIYYVYVILLQVAVYL